MTQELSAQGLLILLAAPDIEELLVDLLLEMPEISGFTSSNVSGHGINSVKLSLIEQVTGRQQRVQFMIYGFSVDLQKIIATLNNKFEKADIRYILLPATDSQVI